MDKREATIRGRHYLRKRVLADKARQASERTEADRKINADLIHDLRKLG